MSNNALPIESLPASPPLPIGTRVKLYLRDLAYRVFVYLALYFVIAVVTIGPFYWHWYGAAFADGPKWIAKFYAPLLWVCEYVPFVSRIVNWYISWW